MFDKLIEESYLILIDSHIRELKVLLGNLKEELRVTGMDTATAIEKGEVLRTLVDEMNIMIQYRKEISDNLKKKLNLKAE